MLTEAKVEPSMTLVRWVIWLCFSLPVSNVLMRLKTTDFTVVPYAKQVTVSLPSLPWELCWCQDPGKLMKKLFSSCPWDWLLLGISESSQTPRRSWGFNSFPVDSLDNTSARLKSVPKPTAVKTRTAHCFPRLWFLWGNCGFASQLSSLLYSPMGSIRRQRAALSLFMDTDKSRRISVVHM